nr:flavonoid O-glycosyltransferase UGT73BQ1 [Scutellaria baicalensis]
MSSRAHQLHIYLLPMMAPGHMIPMVDLARKFSRYGARSTIITTLSNASHFSQTIQRDQENGFHIDISLVDFPSQEAGLPEGCENLSSTTSFEMSLRFLEAMDLLQQPVEKILAQGNPDCIISGAFFWWTTDLARSLGVPRITFYGTGFFPASVWTILRDDRPQDRVGSDSEEFLVPGLPDEIRLSRRQLPEHLNMDEDKNPLAKITRKVLASDSECYGLIVNTFYELEPAYAKHYRETMGRKAWHVGPLSLINNSYEDKSQRGQEISMATRDCLSWLDSKKPNSVIYICFGSMAIFQTPQLHEIAEGLESAGQDFMWVVRAKAEDGENDDCFPQGFETRIKGRGLIIRGWAPQVQILDHEAVGGFITHCGWNSLLEGVAAGVPMVTWPLSAEQFFNQKLVTEILKTGIPVGAEEWTKRDGDRKPIERERIEKAVVELMVGDEAERMREKARNLGDLAKRAVQEGGSSDTDFNSLIHEIRVYRS